MTEPVRTAAQVWEPTHPRAAPVLLAGLTCPWWIAGGWALDLFMGRESRPHQDLDVGILRRDLPRVIEALPEWEFFAARDGTLRRLEDRAPEPKVNSLWCRPQGASRWVLEMLLDDCDGDAAQRPRPADDADFRNVAPRLDDGGRSFLHDALAGIDPHHPWLEVLAAPRGKECA